MEIEELIALKGIDLVNQPPHYTSGEIEKAVVYLNWAIDHLKDI